MAQKPPRLGGALAELLDGGCPGLGAAVQPMSDCPLAQWVETPPQILSAPRPEMGELNLGLPRIPSGSSDPRANG